MGMDFVALMRYAGPKGPALHALDALEDDSPAELKFAARVMEEEGFKHNSRLRSAVWELNAGVDGPRFDQRPDLPTLAVALHTPEDFFLTFGGDAFEVYLLLRWSFFLTAFALQRAVLDACSCLGRLFGASDCIITSDWSPVVVAFREGKSFQEALSAAGLDDGERPTIAELYSEWPEDYLMREIDSAEGGKRMDYKDWPIDKPPPAGWERASVWDSKGYWRLPLV
jgi:hypothetical protein